MPVRLQRPLAKLTNAAERAMLETLQGNILKGHGRDVTAHVFLRFELQQTSAVRGFLKGLAPTLTSAKAQLADAARIRAARLARRKAPKTAAFVGIALSAQGYRALAVPETQIPDDAAFRAGMKARRRLLRDSASHDWDEPYRGEVHAMLLVAGEPTRAGSATSQQVQRMLKLLLRSLPKRGVSVLGIEHGRTYRNERGEGVEHFGYADGRSQPLLLEDDIERAQQVGDGSTRWDPAFGLDQVLVRDSAVMRAHAFGSYFVFRKLEQNVKRFFATRRALCRKLVRAARQQGHSCDADLVGAMLIGRFEDGTPVVLQRAAGMHSPVPNDFDYTSDPEGLKCPLHAHIRKMNPRGETGRRDERSHVLARRGIPYGERKLRKHAFVDAPARGVGLLFMAYQSSIEGQFELIQAAWANDRDFLQSNTGVDPLIGQGGKTKQIHRAGWGEPSASLRRERFADFVRLRGGEYFFAPSIQFLLDL